jgi:hypothetical protein
MKIELITKSNLAGTNVSISFQPKELERYEQLKTVLSQIGWEPSFHNSRTEKVGEACFRKPGSGVFSLWTEEETRANLKDLLPVLKPFGYWENQVRILDLSELL